MNGVTCQADSVSWFLGKHNCYGVAQVSVRIPISRKTGETLRQDQGRLRGTPILFLSCHQVIRSRSRRANCRHQNVRVVDADWAYFT